jgi:hypothetical protein
MLVSNKFEVQDEIQTFRVYIYKWINFVLPIQLRHLTVIANSRLSGQIMNIYIYTDGSKHTVGTTFENVWVYLRERSIINAFFADGSEYPGNSKIKYNMVTPNWHWLSAPPSNQIWHFNILYKWRLPEGLGPRGDSLGKKAGEEASDELEPLWNCTKVRRAMELVTLTG